MAAIAALVGSIMAIGASNAGATPSTVAVYDAIPAPLPGNITSVGPEAYSFAEFGDQVAFAPGSRSLNNVTVTMSSWGCSDSGH